MTGAEVDTIKEAADARAWEELNEEDPHVQAAVCLLDKAVQALQEAEDFLYQAAAEVEDSPETYRIASLEDSVATLKSDVLMQVGRF